MGSFDVYCALCSGSLCQVRIGSKSRRQREVRRRFIAEKAKELEAWKHEHHEPSVSDKSSEEQWEDAEEVHELQSTDEQGSQPEDVEDEEDGDQSYDPEIIKEGSDKWLSIVHVLGYNPGAAGPSKAFISGEGRYVDYGGVECSPGDDPNAPRNPNSLREVFSVSCYWAGGGGLTAFPFHWCCFEILTRVLTGSTDIGKIDKDILYNAMIGLSPEYAGNLAISYGGILGVEQFWESVPGEEYTAIHPTIIPGFEAVLWKLISEKTFKTTSTNRLQLADKVRWDPFSKLPYDILYSILHFLPGDSTRAFMAASWTVYNATRHPTLWKRLMYWGMPWFWELHKLLEEYSTDLEYKNLYLWLDKETMPRYGMDGPFLGIANRRRIWGACTELAERYFSSFHKPDNTTDEWFNSLLQENQIMQLPMVKYPQPNTEVRTISKQWLYTLNEFDSQSALLETFWTSDDCLMGMSVIFGTSRRVFGRGAATDGVNKRILFIESGDWITGFVLFMPEMDLLDNDVYTAVTGIEIILKSGRNAIICSNMGNCRPFMVSEGHHLVGLVGQSGEDEIISRFGILESPITESNEFSVNDVKLVPTSENPFAQRLLWGPRGSPLESSIASRRGECPIWNHPNIHVLSSNRTGVMSDSVPGDLVPYQALIWAQHDHELQKLTQISAYVKKDITSSGPMECILGLRTAYTRRYWEPKRYVGEFPGKDDEDGIQEVLDGDIRHFAIDGPNSEYVVGVEIAMGDFLRALRLRTSTGREICFGDQNQDNWEVARPADGDMFTGLAATFRPLAGYSTISKKANRLMMSSAIALTRTIADLKE